MKTNYWWELQKSRAAYLFWYSIRKVEELNTKKKVYPNTIQMPITYLCNFDCVMCGMHHMTGRHEFSPEEISIILKNPAFDEIVSVGVNGGEPFLRRDLVDCFAAIVSSLKKLKRFYIISNGFFTDSILEKLGEIKKLCEKQGIEVYLSISVDGINDMQDFHRGRKGAFTNASRTLNAIFQDKKRYVDYIDIICTITRYNIYRVYEVEEWAEKIGIEVAYNIATENVRIENEEKVANFSLFSDKHARMMAQEFFYSMYRKTNSEKYFALYLFLLNEKRYAPCPCIVNEWVTLTPDCQIGFCATHSKALGSGLESSTKEILEKNMTYLDDIRNQYCKQCSHYIYKLNAEGLKLMQEDKLKNWFMR